MEKIIVPNSGRGLHFGRISEYDKLKDYWFETKEFDNKNFIYKAMIVDIQYDPDEIYNNMDGYAGCCWSAVILNSNDTTIKQYRFRNFVDLVEMFDKNGYRFVNQ